MSAKSLIKVLTGAALAGAATMAIAVPTLTLSVDGAPAIMCADNAPCDGNPLPGVVVWDVIGIPGLTVSVTTGIAPPVTTLPQLQDMNSIDVTSAGAHTIVLMFSSTGYTSAPGTIFGSFGGTLTAGMTVDAKSWASVTNALFAMTTPLGEIGPFGPPAFSGTSTAAIGAIAPYSLTQQVTVTTGAAGGSFSGDYQLQIPEPGSIALAGIALFALGALGRRKQG